MEVNGRGLRRPSFQGQSEVEDSTVGTSRRMVVRCETTKNSDWTTYTRTVKKFNLLMSGSLYSAVMRAKFELIRLTMTRLGDS